MCLPDTDAGPGLGLAASYDQWCSKLSENFPWHGHASQELLAVNNDDEQDNSD